MNRERIALVAVTGLLVLPVAVDAQSSCENWGGDREEGHCEVRELRIDPVDFLDVDGGQNGGVEIIGWSQSEILIEARVWARARDDAQARELVDDIRVLVERGRVHAEGPRRGSRRESLGVSYVIHAPHETDLELNAQNGGISISDVRGAIDFGTQNGGVHLSGLSGEVHGRTQNGGVTVELDGDRWQGRELDVETQNGGVTVVIPEGFSADFETGTVNGSLDLDFPLTIQGRISKRIRTTLGEGGPSVRVVTTNGGVKLRRSGGARRR